MEKIISVTELAKNAARITADVERGGTTYVVKKGRRNRMVLLDWKYFAGWMATVEEMNRPNWREEWDQSNREIAEGHGRELHVVLKELGLEGPAQSKRRKTAPKATNVRRTKGR